MSIFDGLLIIAVLILIGWIWDMIEKKMTACRKTGGEAQKEPDLALHSSNQRTTAVDPALAQRATADLVLKSSEQQFRLGVAYAMGKGVPQDYQKALHHYIPPPFSVIPRLTAIWVSMYSNGQGVEQDYSKAADWFLKAAQQGVEVAQFNLGFFYATGKGVAQDYAMSLKWSLAAAKQGNVAAKNTTGVIFLNGLGVRERYCSSIKMDQGSGASWYAGGTG